MLASKSSTSGNEDVIHKNLPPPLPLSPPHTLLGSLLCRLSGRVAVPPGCGGPSAAVQARLGTREAATSGNHCAKVSLLVHVPCRDKKEGF